MKLLKIRSLGVLLYVFCAAALTEGGTALAQGASAQTANPSYHRLYNQKNKAKRSWITSEDRKSAAANRNVGLCAVHHTNCKEAKFLTSLDINQ